MKEPQPCWRTGRTARNSSNSGHTNSGHRTPGPQLALRRPRRPLHLNNPAPPDGTSRTTNPDDGAGPGRTASGKRSRPGSNRSPLAQRRYAERPQTGRHPGAVSRRRTDRRHRRERKPIRLSRRPHQNRDIAEDRKPARNTQKKRWPNRIIAESLRYASLLAEKGKHEILQPLRRKLHMAARQSRWKWTAKSEASPRAWTTTASC